jgi:hypothetical protein
MKVVYIVGKVSGLPRKEVVAKFQKAEMMLRKAGYSVINPVEIVPPETDWVEAMKVCIRILTKADHVYLLPCHTKSPGGLTEYCLAKRLKITEIKKEDVLKIIADAKN